MESRTRSSLVSGIALSLISLNAHPHGGDTSLIHACVDAQNVLKFSGPDLECAAGETPVHWSIQGPPGPLDPVLLGRVDALEAQVATLQSQVAGLIDPALPGVIISDVSLAEGASGNTVFQFTVSLTMPSSDTVVMDYATAHGTADASDYAEASGRLVYLPGETSKLVSVNVYGGTGVEDDETFYLTLTNVVNADATNALGTGTILNDDLPAVSVAGPSSGQEGDMFTYDVTLSAPAFVPVSVDFAALDGTATIADNDFVATTGTLVFSPGQTLAQFSVQTIVDSMGEGQENFSVALSNPVNAVLSGASVNTTILDSDLTMSIQDASVVEGNSGSSPVTIMQMSVVLASPVNGNVTFRYGPSAGGTATHAGLFISSGDVKVIPFSSCHADTAPTSCPVVTFSPGETQKTISIQIYGDRTVESDENFFVKIFDAVGASIQDEVAEGIIINDD